MVRFTAIEKALTEVGREHRKIDIAFAWEVMRTAGREGTLHTVVFLPDRREMHVKLARQGVPAMPAAPVRLDLARLLQK